MSGWSSWSTPALWCFIPAKPAGDFRTTFVSEGVKTLWGYKREEFLAESKFWADRLHPDDVARVFEGLQHITKVPMSTATNIVFATTAANIAGFATSSACCATPPVTRLRSSAIASISPNGNWPKAALRESEARLQLIFNGTSDLQILFRVAPANGFIVETINRAVIENFHGNTGKDLMDFVGRPFEELLAITGLTPQQIEHRRALYLRAIHERTTVRFETPQTPLRDAAEVEVSPVIDQNGHCTHVLWSARNVTDRVKAVSALLESEERYALVTEATLDGIFDWNLATGDSHLSPRLKEILGFRDHELANDFSAFFGRVHPDDLNWLSQLVVRLNADRTLEKFDQEVRLRRKDGSYCWVVSPRPSGARRPGPAHALHRSHSRHHRTQASRRRLGIPRRHRAISDDSIVGSNLDGTILSWNASSERFWGYTRRRSHRQKQHHSVSSGPPERIHGQNRPNPPR